MLPDILRAAFPNLTEAELRAKQKKTHGRVLTLSEQKTYLQYFSLGHSTPDICRLMGIAVGAVLATQEVTPDFRRDCLEIEEQRHLQIESQVLRLSTGKCRITKKTLLARKNGDTFIYKNGKQVFVCTKQEVTDVPPNPALLMWYLQKRWPEKYGDLQGKTEIPKTPDEILRELEEAVKDAV